MNISSFVDSILPLLKKDTIVDDCVLTAAELNEITSPLYDQAAPFLKTWKFKNEDVQNMDSVFLRNAGQSNGNSIIQIQRGLKVLSVNLERVKDLIKQTYNEEVAAEGLTYQKAQLLQFVEFAAFVSKYARKYLDYVYIAETEAVDPESADIRESLTEGDREWVRFNMLNFALAFRAVATPSDSFLKALHDIPDIVITKQNAKTLPHTIGTHKLDPMNAGLIPVALNPIFHLRMLWEEWQHSRYKAAKEELQLIQLRKLNLERVSAGKPDAKVQREIRYLEQRVDNLNNFTRQIEAKGQKG